MMRRRMYHSNLHDLFYSLIHGGLSALDTYIRNGGSLKICGPDRKSLLIGCIEESQDLVFHRCLELGVDIEAADDMGMTALHWAAEKHMGNCVKALLARGARVDRGDNEGRTALMIAVSGGDYMDIVKQLVEAGCSLNSANEEGYTALHLSAHHKKLETVKYLLQQGSDTFLRTDRGDSSISLALSNKDLKTVQMILDHNGRVCEGSVYSPEMNAAVKRRYADAVEMLLSYGVDPFPDEDSFDVGNIFTGSSSRRLRESLISEYGYFTSSGPENKLMLYIFKNHMFLRCFSLLKLMFLYGFRSNGTEDMLNCNDKCMCRKMIEDMQKLTNYSCPSSLNIICRTTIRVCLGLGVVKKAEVLPLPNKLKRYLCMSGEYCLEKSPI